jgi:hypothetical protein
MTEKKEEKFNKPEEEVSPRILGVVLFVGGLGAFGYALFALFEALMLFQFQDLVPGWFYIRFIDNEPSLGVFEFFILLLFVSGFLATKKIKPEIFYPAGLIGLALAAQILILVLSPIDLSIDHAKNITETIALFIVKLIRWIPLFLLFVLAISYCGFQAKGHIGKKLSNYIGWSSLIIALSLVASYIGLSGDIVLFIYKFSQIICFSACGIVLFRLARARL